MSHIHERLARAASRSMVLLIMTACNSAPVAPDDGTIQLIVDRRELTADGDQTTVHAVVLFADKSIAGKNWDIDFTVAGGSIDSGLVAVRKRSDLNGTASINVRSGRSPGSLIVTARCGAAVVADTITVKPPDTTKVANP